MWFQFGMGPVLQAPLQVIENAGAGRVARALLGLEFSGAAPFTNLVNSAGLGYLE